MLNNDLEKVRKKAAIVANQIVAEREAVLLHKIKNLEARIEKLESVPKTSKKKGLKDAEL